MALMPSYQVPDQPINFDTLEPWRTDKLRPTRQGTESARRPSRFGTSNGWATSRSRRPPPNWQLDVMEPRPSSARTAKATREPRILVAMPTWHQGDLKDTSLVNRVADVYKATQGPCFMPRLAGDVTLPPDKPWNQVYSGALRPVSYRSRGTQRPV